MNIGQQYFNQTTNNGMNNTYTYPRQNHSFSQNTWSFPQPQGTVFSINQPSEVNNIPVNNGLSAIFYLPENLLYLKTYQNGDLILNAYKISPINSQTTEKESVLNNPNDNLEKVLSKLEKIEERLTTLENTNKLNSSNNSNLSEKENNGGSTLQWQI